MKMEVSVASLALSVLVVVIVSVAGRVLNWVWFRPKRLEKCLRQQGFSGRPYRILYGDMKENGEMVRKAKSSPISLSDDIMPRVAPLLHRTVQTYGKKSFVWVGPVPRVNIMDPEHVRDVLTRNYEIQKPKTNPLILLLVSGLVNYEGEKWARHRRIINPAFNVEKVKVSVFINKHKVNFKVVNQEQASGKCIQVNELENLFEKKLSPVSYDSFEPIVFQDWVGVLDDMGVMVPVFRESCSDMISKWKKSISEEGSYELDVWPHLQELSCDIISRTAFGSNYEEGKNIFDLLKELAQLTIQSVQSVYIPGWSFLPTKANQRMKLIDREIRTSLRSIIAKKEKTMRAGKERTDDLLGILMSSNHAEIQDHGNNKSVGMSIDDVMEECKLFYFAGQETTSTLLVWTMVLLSQHLDWQEKAREEVLEVFGDNIPDFDGLTRLKTMTMIVNEVFRLYPPAILINRAAHQDVKIGNVVIPAGTLISMPTILVHRDREFWGDDASEFNPERFSRGISKAATKHVSFFPFGWGPRICIGQNFALVESKVALAMILQSFSFELSPSYIHAPHTVITLQPQHGALITLKKL